MSLVSRKLRAIELIAKSSNRGIARTKEGETRHLVATPFAGAGGLCHRRVSGLRSMGGHFHAEDIPKCASLPDTVLCLRDRPEQLDRRVRTGVLARSVHLCCGIACPSLPEPVRSAVPKWVFLSPELSSAGWLAGNGAMRKRCCGPGRSSRRRCRSGRLTSRSRMRS